MERKPIWGRRLQGILLAGLLVGSVSAWAQAPRSRSGVASNQEIAAPAAKPGEIDLKRSRIYVHVDKTRLGHEHGIEGKIKSGNLKLGAKNDAGQVEFDMTSFLADTDSARKYVGLEGSTPESRRKKVEQTMLGEDVLNVAKYPTATWTISSAVNKKTKQGKPVVELKGEFTLCGETRPLTILAQSTRKDGQWNLRGDFTILQTDFGMTPYKAALGAVGVADQLKIYGDLWIVGDAPAQE